MSPGEPVTPPAPAAGPAPAAREIPKSITRGPSRDSLTFEGFRSQCTTPAAWMALRLSASPAARASAGRAAIGPSPVTASASEGPATYPVASHGTGLSTSASATRVVNRPLTRRTAATSRANRTGNSVPRPLRADHLHCDRPAALGQAQEHISHAAAAEPADQPVRTDPLRIPQFKPPSTSCAT